MSGGGNDPTSCHVKALSEPEEARGGAGRGNGVGRSSFPTYTMGVFEDTWVLRGFKTSEKPAPQAEAFPQQATAGGHS